MEPDAIQLEKPSAEAAQLDAINHVVEAAVMGWDLTERVKRLALPSYRYTPIDLQHLDLLLAKSPAGDIVGVAASEPADAHDCPKQQDGMLLHGLFVDPDWQRRGIGRRLLDRVIESAQSAGCAGVLVKAQHDAAGFFITRGFTRLPADDGQQRYVHRLWRALT